MNSYKVVIEGGASMTVLSKRGINDVAKGCEIKFRRPLMSIDLLNG